MFGPNSLKWAPKVWASWGYGSSPLGNFENVSHLPFSAFWHHFWFMLWGLYCNVLPGFVQVLESHGILWLRFPGLESHGKCWLCKINNLGSFFKQNKTQLNANQVNFLGNWENGQIWVIENLESHGKGHGKSWKLQEILKISIFSPCFQNFMINQENSIRIGKAGDSA